MVQCTCDGVQESRAKSQESEIYATINPLVIHEELAANFPGNQGDSGEGPSRDPLGSGDGADFRGSAWFRDFKSHVESNVTWLGYKTPLAEMNGVGCERLWIWLCGPDKHVRCGNGTRSRRGDAAGCIVSREGGVNEL